MLLQLNSALTFYRCRTCRFVGEVEDDKSDADSGHNHKEKNKQNRFQRAHFSAATRTFLCLHEDTRSEDAPRCGSISSFYRQHQQGVQSGDMWTLNPELVFRLNWSSANQRGLEKKSWIIQHRRDMLMSGDSVPIRGHQDVFQRGRQQRRVVDCPPKPMPINPRRIKFGTFNSFTQLLESNCEMKEDEVKEEKKTVGIFTLYLSFYLQYLFVCESQLLASWAYPHTPAFTKINCWIF